VTDAPQEECAAVQDNNEEQKQQNDKEQVASPTLLTPSVDQQKEFLSLIFSPTISLARKIQLIMEYYTFFNFL
jgi:hypothetical protein